MALSERLQMKKIQEASGNDEQEFALVLFEDEDKYSVVETSRIQEKYYVVNQTVHVLWGMGKSVTPFRAKLILCGTKEDCDKEALNLSFSSSPSHLRLKDDYDSNSEPEIQEKTMLKRKGKDHVRVPVKKNKESNKSASASWQANLEEEQQKLKHAVNLNSQQELLRSFTGSVKRDSSPLQHDLSSIITRLDSIEEKVDALLKMPWSQLTRNPAPQTFATPTPPASRSGSPLMPKERNDTRLASHSVSDEEALETSEMVFNGIDLLALKAPPREPTRYATRLAGVLFTKEELTMGMIPPLNEKYNRQPLDPSRVSMMRNCISQKYSGKVATKCWADIRRAVNQKCNDIRKKNVSGSAEHLQDENN